MLLYSLKENILHSFAIAQKLRILLTGRYVRRAVASNEICGDGEDHGFSRRKVETWAQLFKASLA